MLKQAKSLVQSLVPGKKRGFWAVPAPQRAGWCVTIFGFLWQFFIFLIRNRSACLRMVSPTLISSVATTYLPTLGLNHSPRFLETHFLSDHNHDNSFLKGILSWDFRPLQYFFMIRTHLGPLKHTTVQSFRIRFRLYRDIASVLG